MIKYFHKLTREELKALCVEGMTYKELAKDYPQPIWCAYPEAVMGLMGCWSLMDFRVTGRSFCRDCELYIKKSRSRKDKVKDK